MIKEGGCPETYKREIAVHKIDCIRKSPYIRQLHEAFGRGIDNRYMIFEWMEHGLWSLQDQKKLSILCFRRRLRSRYYRLSLHFQTWMGRTRASTQVNLSLLFNETIRVALMNYLEIYPFNILVSDANSPKPTVKLAHLGNRKYASPSRILYRLTLSTIVIPAGEQHEYGPPREDRRAPELWMGRRLSTACDVWALGVSIC